MAVQIGTGDLSYGGAVMETSGGNIVTVILDSNVIEVWEDIDGTPTLVDSDTAATIHGGGNIAYIDAILDMEDDIHVASACSSEQTRDVAWSVCNLSTGFGTWVEAADYTEAAPLAPFVSMAMRYTVHPYDIINMVYVDRVKVGGNTQDNVYHVSKSYTLEGAWTTPYAVGNRSVKTYTYNKPQIATESINGYFNIIFQGVTTYAGTFLRRYTTGWAAMTGWGDGSGGSWNGIAAEASGGGSTVHTCVLDLDDDSIWHAQPYTESDTGFDADTDGRPASVVVGTDHYIFYRDTSDDIHVISDTGSGWTDEGAIQVGTYVFVIPEWAQFHCPDQSEGINYIFDDGTYVYYDFLSLAEGTDTSDDTPAYMEGIEYNVKDSTPAWTRSGWDVDASTPAYMEGLVDIRYDVVTFNANESISTQDITGSLNGYTPKLAFFFGYGGIANDTVTADMRYFFGFTNGTGEYMYRTHIIDGGTNSFSWGGVTSAYCAGMDYGTAGHAAFDSFITNGVRLDWDEASNDAYKCAALLIAEPSGASMIQSYIGTWSDDDSEIDDVVEVTGVGFKPDLLIMLNDPGGAGFTIAAASRMDHDVIKQAVQTTTYNSGYFNYPGVNNQKDQIMTHGILHGVEGWEIKEWTDDGFDLICTDGDGVRDNNGYYIAIKLGSPHQPKLVINRMDDVTGTGDWEVITQNKPEAVMTFQQRFGWNLAHQGYYPADCSPQAISFFDSATEAAGTARIGYGGASPWIAKSVVHDDRAMLNYGWTPGNKDNEGALKTLDGSGYTIDITTWTVPWGYIAVSFGQSKDAKSSQHAYMAAHKDYQEAFIAGGVATKSSISAFFNVIDAYSKTHAFTLGESDLPLQTSDTPAYMKGTDTIVIAVVTATASGSTGTQDITTTELMGLTPKAAIVTVYGSNEDTPNTSYMKLSEGFTDGVNTSCSSIASAYDTSWLYNVASAKHRGPASSTNLILALSAPLTYSGQAVFDSWITNGIRIDWTDSCPSYKISVTFFAGSDLSADVDFIEYGEVESPYLSSTTAPGFRPDLLFLCGCLSTTDLWMFDDNWGTVGHYLHWAVRDTEIHEGRYGFTVGMGVTPGPFAGTPPNCYYTTPIIGSWSDGAIASGARVDSFDTNGFTIYNPTSGSPWYAFLALCFGATVSRRRAIAGHVHFNIDDDGEMDYRIVPFGGGNDYSLTPEWMFLSMAPQRIRTYYGGSFPYYYYAGKYGTTFQSIITEANMASVDLATWGIQLDCTSLYHDQIAKMYFTQQYPVKNFYVGHRTESTDYNPCWTLSKKRFVRDGIRMEWDYMDWPTDELYGPVLDDAYGLALAIGIPHLMSSTPAYMRGQKDWPGRTPHGCYMEGSGAEVSSDTDAFLQGLDNVTSDNNAYTFGVIFTKDSQPAFMDTDAVDSDNQPAYINGYEANKSVNPAHTHGQEHVSTQQAAYLNAEDYANSSNEAYLSAVVFESSDNEAFVCGGDDADSSQAAYLAGPVGSIIHAFMAAHLPKVTSIPAFMLGSEDEKSSSDAYLHGGVFVSDSTIAYTGGIDTAADSIYAYLTGHVVSSTPAYLGGEIVIVDYMMLINSDSSLSKKFRVVAEGYSHGQLMKGSQINRTVGGGTDLQASAIYKVWEPTIKVMETESLVGYGDLGDLETFYEYNDPDGTPSNVLTLRNHYQEEFQVLAVGQLAKLVVTQRIEGTNAIYYVRLAMMEKK